MQSWQPAAVRLESEQDWLEAAGGMDTGCWGLKEPRHLEFKAVRREETWRDQKMWHGRELPRPQCRGCSEQKSQRSLT